MLQPVADIECICSGPTGNERDKPFWSDCERTESNGTTHRIAPKERFTNAECIEYRERPLDSDERRRTGSASAALPGSRFLDMFWPLFGVGVIVGALLATRLRVSGDLRLMLAAGYFVQAAGIALSVWSPSLAGFAIGSLLLGLPFTAITFFAMQEVRRLRPATVASTMGLMTAAYGIGQIVGPPMVAFLLQRSGSAGAGFTLSLQVVAAALLAGMALYLWMARAYPGLQRENR